MSHVLLNIVYRLRMLASGRLRARGPLQRLVALLVRAPNGCDKLLSGATSRVLDGVRVIPDFAETAERGALSAIVDTTRVIPVLGERPEGGTAPAPEGAVQRAARYSSLVEGLAVSGAIRVSTALQRLQRSMERSLLTSALLSGVVTTLALLFIALRSR